MLRCRKCRRGVVDSACLTSADGCAVTPRPLLNQVEAVDENLCGVCSVWHVNVATLPDWILTSVQQAQWTVGKLNCLKCHARLGSFNFTNRASCPCGQDATVHLNKSRVDPDGKHHVRIVQPRVKLTTRAEGGRAILPTDDTERRPEFNLTAPDSLQRLPCFCPSVVVDSSFVSGCRRSLVDQQLQEALESSEETARVHQEVSDPTVLLRGRTVSGGVTEREEEPAPRASAASSSLSKREKNRLKRLWRKQRRRERWLHRQLQEEKRVSESLLDEESERLTCAVCLEVYVRPHSCQPCGHVFCEPCLRTLARNRPANTPCPLCRALISKTDLHEELHRTAESLFPKVVHGRQRIFQNAPCAKWPLPRRRKCFSSFWGFQRRATRRGRRSAHGGVALDFSDIRDWLTDVVLVQTNPVNWILVCLVLGFLASYFVV